MTQNKYNQLLNINLSIYLNLENKDIEHNKLIKIIKKYNKVDKNSDKMSEDYNQKIKLGWNNKY